MIYINVSPRQPNELPLVIFQHWIHSYEEDATDAKVYRPSHYNFPPSRGRSGFEIRKNGEFINYGIAPTDGIRKVGGRWKAEGTNIIRVYLEDPKQKSYVMKILSCDENVLRIEK